MKWKNLHKWNPRWYMFYSILQQSLQDGAHTIYKWSFFVPFLNGLQKSRVCLGTPTRWIHVTLLGPGLAIALMVAPTGMVANSLGDLNERSWTFEGEVVFKRWGKKTKSSRGKMMKVPGIYVLQILQFVFIFRYLRFYVLKGEGLR